MKKIIFLFHITLFAYSGICQTKIEGSPEITSSELREHVFFLASDELEGRYSGSVGCSLAANYIKNNFILNGLIPLFNDSYIQEFQFISGMELTDNNSLQITSVKSDKSLTIREDYIPAPFSDNIEIKSEIVFAGYGISAPKLNYDDYEGIDVSGKMVIVMRYNPEYDNPHSQFDEFSSFRYKATTARDKGATGIIFVNGHYPKDEEDKLIELKYDMGGPVKDIAAIHIKRDFVNELFKSQNLDFSEYQKKITESKKPGSFSFNDINIKLNTGIKEKRETTWNVAGYVEGNDPELKNEFLVIGAHFDHLGWGQTGSLYRGNEPQIHNGADDNASGTAGVIEIAEKFVSQKDRLKRSVMFVTFSGEELGLLGSSHFVNNTPVPVSNMTTMINMDMIGRLNENNELIVYGTGTSPGWKELLNNHNTYDFNLAFHDEGFGPSDHSSFYAKEIPVLFFFTGTHTDYHRPSDDADKINYEGKEKILNYVYDIAYSINTSEDRPQYVSVPRKDSGTMSGWKVYVGTIPDYASDVEGFKISGVNEGSPAQKGGMKAGDIMISFDGKKITNIYDYVYALQEHVPGDVVEVIVKRNDEELKLEIELGAR